MFLHWTLRREQARARGGGGATEKATNYRHTGTGGARPPGRAALSPTHPSQQQPATSSSLDELLSLDELKLCRLRMLLPEESTALRDVDMDELRLQVWRGLVRSSDFGQRVGAGAAVPYFVT